MTDWLDTLTAQTAERRACALATVVAIEGSVSADLGAKAVFDDQGSLLAGWVGGGCAQARVAERAAQCLRTARSELLTLDLRSAVLGEGMPCGGTMTVFIDPILPPPMVWVLGHGPLAEALCMQAALVGFAVTVLDARAEASRFPAARAMVSDDPAYRSLSEASAADYVVIATQHKGDHLILRQVLARPFAYVGLIASRHRAALVWEDLVQSGLLPDQWAHVRTPAGLDLGARTPAEIAVAVVAELIAVRRQRAARPESILESKRFG